jgi:hypothetical protein
VAQTQTKTYEVTIRYCDDTRFSHEHDVAAEAVSEYTEMLLLAIEPKLNHAEARHLREVVMYVLDEETRTTHKMTSGIFPCVDRKAPSDGSPRHRG